MGLSFAPVVLLDGGLQGRVDPCLGGLGVGPGGGNVSAGLGTSLALVLGKGRIASLVDVEESLGNNLAIVEKINGRRSGVGSAGDSQGSTSKESAEHLGR